MGYDYSRNCAVDIAKTLLTARHETKSARPEYVTYDEICTAWDDYRHDRRYKLSFGAGTDFGGVVSVGKCNYCYVIQGNICYIRLIVDSHSYEIRPCFKVEMTDCGDYYTFVYGYQSDYQI